jgi:hypothetical protein
MNKAIGLNLHSSVRMRPSISRNRSLKPIRAHIEQANIVVGVLAVGLIADITYTIIKNKKENNYEDEDVLEYDDKDIFLPQVIPEIIPGEQDGDILKVYSDSDSEEEEEEDGLFEEDFDLDDEATIVVDSLHNHADYPKE